MPENNLKPTNSYPIKDDAYDFRYSPWHVRFVHNYFIPVIVFLLINFSISFISLIAVLMHCGLIIFLLLFYALFYEGWIALKKARSDGWKSAGSQLFKAAFHVLLAGFFLFSCHALAQADKELAIEFVSKIEKYKAENGDYPSKEKLYKFKEGYFSQPRLRKLYLWYSYPENSSEADREKGPSLSVHGYFTIFEFYGYNFKTKKFDRHNLD